MKKAVIIIPTYNEKENIAKIVPRIFAVAKKITNYNIQVLVVDDTSPDRTFAVVRQMQKKYPKLHLVINAEKSGLGGAYMRGMKEAFGKLRADYIFEFDADGSHDPEKLPEFFQKLDDGFDFVIGGRYKDGGSIDPDWPAIRKFYSVFGNIVIMIVLTDFRIRDWTSGYRAIGKKVYAEVIKEMAGERFSGYTWQIGFLHKAVRKNFRITEVPIHFKDRQVGESKLGSEYIKNTLIYIFRERILEIVSLPVFRFLVVGGVGFLIQLMVFNLLRFAMSDIAATPISTEIAIISNFILNNKWTFADKKITGKKLLPQFVTFNLTSLGSLVIQTVVMWLGKQLAPEIQMLWFDAGNIYLMIGIILGMVWNYFAYNTFVWRK